MNDNVRITAEQDLRWLHSGIDPEEMEQQVRREIEEAQTATSTPRHWHPIEVDEALMR